MLIKETKGIKGQVRWELFDKNHKLKASGVSHNLVVNEGDDYLVDQLATTPAQDAMAYMALGTGYTAVAKDDTWLESGYADNGKALDATYPQIKAGGGNENILQYKTTFDAGEATQNGIDEILISNAAPEGGGGEPTGQILARAQITPEVNKAASDTLVATWELTFLGA